MSHSYKKNPFVCSKRYTKEYHRTIKRNLRQITKSLHKVIEDCNNELFDEIQYKLLDYKKFMNDYDYMDWRFITNEKEYLRK